MFEEMKLQNRESGEAPWAMRTRHHRKMLLIEMRPVIQLGAKVLCALHTLKFLPCGELFSSRQLLEEMMGSQGSY
jgi:hypothetical protein